MRCPVPASVYKGQKIQISKFALTPQDLLVQTEQIDIILVLILKACQHEMIKEVFQQSIRMLSQRGATMLASNSVEQQIADIQNAVKNFRQEQQQQAVKEQRQQPVNSFQIAHYQQSINYTEFFSSLEKSKTDIAEQAGGATHSCRSGR